MKYFAELYNRIVSKDSIKKLSNAQLQELLEQNADYLDAEYRALATEIHHRFQCKKFEPEVCTMTAPLVLTATAAEYKFSNFQMLKDTILVDFSVPIYNSLTLYITGQTYLSIANTAQAFLTLKNDRQQDIVFREPLVDYFRDTAYWEGKGKFQEARMDWDNSLVAFPSTTIPAANVGTVIAPVISYIDMKRYPYLMKKPA